jgi:hypothetical protein
MALKRNITLSSSIVMVAVVAVFVEIRVKKWRFGFLPMNPLPTDPNDALDQQPQPKSCQNH